MEELKSKFNALSKNEKLVFIKAIMPEFCKIFSENPQEMMKEMMPALLQRNDERL